MHREASRSLNGCYRSMLLRLPPSWISSSTTNSASVSLLIVLRRPTIERQLNSVHKFPPDHVRAAFPRTSIHPEFTDLNRDIQFK